MSAGQVITEGTTSYTKPAGRWTNWTYTDNATGIVFETGTDLITEARRRVFDHLRQLRTATQSATYTIASGPRRSRGGHQRLRAWNFA